MKCVIIVETLAKKTKCRRKFQIPRFKKPHFLEFRIAKLPFQQINFKKYTLKMIQLWNRFSLLLLATFICSFASQPTLPVWNYPVIYVVYGDIPLYLRINIELASRRNPVVVISNSLPPSVNASSTYNVMYESMSLYSASADKFAPHYIHLARDQSPGRQKHELHCIQRWFILRDYMTIKGISHALFGDGDASIFVNVKDAFMLRPGCNATINIEMQYHNVHWVGAGESSLWTTAAITDFCAFAMEVYQTKRHVLQTKHNYKMSAVVDMSILWLWWVAHKDQTGWDAGRPWSRQKNNRDQQKSFDASFTFTKNLKLPPPTIPNLNLCNGMDVVNRSVFDHMHGWSYIPNITLDLQGEGRPYGKGTNLELGGRPERMNATELTQLASKRLYFNSLHYQGDSKKNLPYDICRILLQTGNKRIEDEVVREKCVAELQAHPSTPCRLRINDEGNTICF